MTSHMRREIAEQPAAVAATLAAVASRPRRWPPPCARAASTASCSSRAAPPTTSRSTRRYLLEARCALSASLAAPSLYTTYRPPVDSRARSCSASRSRARRPRSSRSPLTLLRRARCSASRRPLTLLIATGTGICGAVGDRRHGVGQRGAAARRRPSRSRRSTALGTVAMVGLPFLRTPLGLDMTDYGIWSGASVQEVAQVVAPRRASRRVALKIGTLVKLARVALLAPLVFGVRRSRAAAAGRAGTPLVPGFVIGFLALAAVRRLGAIAARPGSSLDLDAASTCWLLAAGMAGLGLGLALSRLRGLRRAAAAARLRVLDRDRARQPRARKLGLMSDASRCTSPRTRTTRSRACRRR